jgi:hypothetical protein
MKNLYPLIISVLMAFAALSAKAQSGGGGFSALVQSGPADATRLVNAYGEPLFKGIGIGLNSGWYNTAKAKKLLHFDARLSVSAAFVPASDKTFNVTQIGLSNNVRPDNPSQVIAPTFGGSKSVQGPLLDIYDDNGRKVGSFNTPSGKLGFVPAPQLQLTIGLVQNTDLTVRGIPTVSIGSGNNISSIGFGLRHDLIQDFVGKKAAKLIPFDLAVAVGYSHLNLNVGLNVQPDNGAQPKDSQQSTDFSNQHVAATFNNLMAEVIFSKKIAFFTPFVSVGYNNTHTAFGTIGNFPITTGATFTGVPTYTTYTNPININETSINGFRADLGFELTPGFFRIFVSGSMAQYSSVNAGIGFGF